MKVLLVSYSDSGGGADIACYRLHRAFLSVGIDSTLLVSKKKSGDFTVLGSTDKVSHTWKDIRNYFSYPLQKLIGLDGQSQHSFNVIPSGLHKVINSFGADIVNLHWVNKEMLSIKDISMIHSKIVWTLHDMWPFSGASHYVDDANVVQGFEPISKGLIDLDHWVWQRKQRFLSDKDISFVTPSHWLADSVSKSSLFNKNRVEVIHNPIDTSIFKPLDKKFCHNALNLDPNKCYICFGAINSLIQKRKGWALLRDAIKCLSIKVGKEVELLIFGASEPERDNNLALPSRYLGYLHDDYSLALLYNSADVFVLPSLQDNLPNTMVESMACGTPCVSFDVGGMPDLIEHKVNGYLAKAFDTVELADGIEWILNQSLNGDDLGKHARKMIQDKSEFDLVAQSYYEYFIDLL